MTITKTSFGKTHDGKEASLYKLANAQGMYAEITNYGGIIVSLYTYDRHGKLDDIVLGFDKLEPYFTQSPYFGALIGRHGNRIEDARFELNGRTYTLAANNGGNHLHGGTVGFDKVLWDAAIVKDSDTEKLQLSYVSEDGEEGYPGRLETTVYYSLSDDGELKIEYGAVSDQDTVVNLTNHAYFNLAGHGSGDITNHRLMIRANRFTLLNSEVVPTGEIADVKGTPMDFTELKPIGPGLRSGHAQIECGQGYDHNWVLDVSGEKPELAAELFEPDSGRLMQVYTTKPGLQFYSGNFLDGSIVGKGGAVYAKWSGLCLETQYFPNAMKHKHFPSPILKAGEPYRHTTSYTFSVRS